MKTIIITGTLIVLAALALSVYALQKGPKIAVVRSGEVLDKYAGMKEARSIYEKKLAGYQYIIDSMQRDLSVSVQNEVPRKTEVLQQVTENFRQAAEQENQRLTASAMNQFNTYVQEYAKEHSYNVVLGVTLSGNILYAGETEDITQQVLEGLNNKYKGK